MVFENFLYNFFPPYFHQTDSYKVGGNGIWKRFLSIFGREVDDYVYNKIQGLADLKSLDEKNFIRHLAFMLGNIPQGNFDNDTYKRFLVEATYIFKIKGTKESYIRLIKLINPNYVVTITEHFAECSRRDNEPDRDNPNALRDICCVPCQEYSVTVTDTSQLPTLNPLPAINWAINILEPINAKLRTLTYVPPPPLADELNITITESLVVTLDNVIIIIP
jgi:hypothetical protein